ncbi:MAG: ribosome-associated translation inhibitor RaiA [Deltaproteobacteria bacterium]|nr:ribosome-associated translation inhibitor RaiA [Deltaproteobacteria bacterium]
MNISFTFRNTDAEEWLKDYAGKKLARIQKYIDKPIDAQVTLSVEKFRSVAEIKVSTKGITLNGKEEAKEMALAIDKVVEKIERQIKKHKEKTRNHKENASKAEELELAETFYEDEHEDEIPSGIAETRRVVLRPMSVDDAMMEMEESKNTFAIYRDLSTEEVRLLYRREDGNYILVEAGI